MSKVIGVHPRDKLVPRGPVPCRGKDTADALWCKAGRDLLYGYHLLCSDPSPGSRPNALSLKPQPSSSLRRGVADHRPVAPFRRPVLEATVTLRRERAVLTPPSHITQHTTRAQPALGPCARVLQVSGRSSAAQSRAATQQMRPVYTVATDDHTGQLYL